MTPRDCAGGGAGAAAGLLDQHPEPRAGHPRVQPRPGAGQGDSHLHLRQLGQQGGAGRQQHHHLQVEPFFYFSSFSSFKVTLTFLFTDFTSLRET